MVSWDKRRRTIAAGAAALAVNGTIALTGTPTAAAPALTGTQLAATSAAAPASSLAPAAAVAAARGRGVEVIAHRGGLGAPENSLAAIRHAIRTGADAVEIDVRLSRDGAKVLMHDLTVNRTTRCSGRVDRMTWKQLSRCGVPSLNQALRVMRRSDLRAYLHVKDVPTMRAARSLMHSVKANGMNNNRTILFASNGRLLDRLDRAGAKRPYLGKLFSSPTGWSSKYRTLVPFDTAVTDARVAKAHRQGHRVVAVEGHPLGLGSFRGRGLDGFMANRLGRVLDILGR